LSKKSKNIMHEPALISPLEEENWNNLLISTPGYSFFHTSNWADVLQKSYGYRPIYFTIFGEDHLLNLLPIMEVKSFLTGRRGVSLPFSDYCEPIVADKAQFQEVFAAAVAFGKKQKWRYLEFRGGEPFFQGVHPYAWYYGHTLDLAEGPQKLFAGLRYNMRYDIKKAEKEKIDVAISASPAAVKAFCRLNAITRRDHGLPSQPHRFFQCMYDNIISQGRGFIVMASWRGTVIAANVYFTFGDQVIHKYGASDRAYQSLQATKLVMWEAIKWSCEKRFQSLSFGRTEPENEGLMQFKAGWGVKPYKIYYYRYDLQKNIFTSDSSDINPLFNKIFSKLPIPVLNILGRILYRHLG